MAAPRKRHRRDFLRGRSAADALAEVADRALQGAAPENGGQTHSGRIAASPATELSEGYLARMSRRAMACEFEVVLTAGQYPHGAEAALAALDLVERLEEQMSVFRGASEISRLNHSAHEAAITVEARLFDLLCVAQRLHDETGGAFDITAGPLSRAWGFTIRQGSMPSSEALEAALASVGSRWLELNHEAQTVRYLAPGVEINLGAIGKGYALDRAAEALAAAEISDFVLHGGQSSVLARGARRPGPDSAGWLVGLRDPLRVDRPLAQIRLTGGALGTSGSGSQYFMHEGRRLGHLLDPRTGWPAEGVLTATAIAPTAAEADALATAFYVMGNTAAAEYCQAHPSVAALITTPGARSGSLELHVHGLEKEPTEGLTPIFGRLAAG